MFRRASDDAARVGVWISLGLWLKEHWPSVVTVLSFTGGGSWLASYIDPIRSQGPGAMILVGLFFAAFLAITWAAVCQGWASWQSARRTQSAVLPSAPAHTKIELTVSNEAKPANSAVEPPSSALKNDLVVSNKTVRLSDIADPDRPLVRGRSFFNVRFVGPGVIAMNHSTLRQMNACKFECNPSCDPGDLFFEMQEPRILHGIYCFEDCRVEHITFSNISFVVPSYLIQGLRDQLRRSMNGDPQASS